MKALTYLQHTRNEIWKSKSMPYPLNKENRPFIVNTLGEPLKESAYHSAWQRFIRNAINNKVIEKEERFSLHDLKRKGVTDTEGTRAEKQEASGHKSEKMMDVYDKSIPKVKPASD